MQKSFLSYGRQDINEQDIQAVVNVLKGSFLTQGPAVEAFEHQLASFCKTTNAIAVSNGTAALHLACLALGIGPGDAVIVPAITFAATANAVLYTGGTPIFADIDPGTLCISISSAEEAATLAKKSGLNLKAIFPVHFAGRPIDLTDLKTFSRKHNLAVVEDCCHALGAQYRLSSKDQWHHVGTHEDHIGVFSFHPVKHITTGEGGALTTNNPTVAAKLRALRSHGIVREPEHFTYHEDAYESGFDRPNPWYHEMQVLGFNYRMCDIQAALGTSQLCRAEEFVARRHQIAHLYEESLRPFNSTVRLPSPDSQNIMNSFHLFPIQIDFEQLGMKRIEVMDRLRANGIGTQVHYIPVFRHPFYRQNTQKWLAADCSTAMTFYQRELSLPMYPSMSNHDVQRSSQALQEILTKFSRS